jgi:hypothetical protein
MTLILAISGDRGHLIGKTAGDSMCEEDSKKDAMIRNYSGKKLAIARHPLHSVCAMLDRTIGLSQFAGYSHKHYNISTPRSQSGCQSRV